MIDVRPVRLEDAAAIVDMLNPIIEDGRFTVMTEPITLESQQAWLRDVMSTGVCYVAVEGENVVGIQSVEPISREPAQRHVGDISTFMSLSKLRQGVGTLLTHVVLEAAKEKGFRKVVASVRMDNLGAYDFYRRMGFQRVGGHKEHALIRGIYVDQVVMEWFL